MAFNDKQKKRIVAITRQLKEQKGVTIKQSELAQDLASCKQRQKKVLEIKEQFKDVPVIQEQANESHKKLQRIIDDLNDYMAILHPEGLLDYGSGSAKSIVGNG